MRDNFEDREIKEEQDWQGIRLEFDPDASPEAWEHYGRYYVEAFEEYDVCAPGFFSYYEDRERGRNVYRPIPGEKRPCRLYALRKGTILLKGEGGYEYYQAALRLGGETDFNFKEAPDYGKRALANWLKDDPEYMAKLEECKKRQHNLLNFSLMQTVGNMQGFKGRICDDRPDRFLYYLGKFYETDREKRQDTDIIQYATRPNRKCLLGFLNQFADIMDYCGKVYSIYDVGLIERLRRHGQKELNSCENVRLYIDLAYDFWEEKKRSFSQKLFFQKTYLTIGS